VYLQLVEQVKDAVAAGALQPGDLLPAARPLAEALVLSPSAVARAYQALALEGILNLTIGREPVLATLAGHAGRRRTAGDRHEAERAKWAFELDLAREVQQYLLPQGREAFAGLDCAGISRACLGVGGDYYDFLHLANHTTAFAIGDVCGKGPGAGLLMATLRAYLRSQTRELLADPEPLMATLNELVFESSSANRFASLFYAHYDQNTQRLDYVNAGHPPVLVFSASDGYTTARRLDAGGPVIGMMPGCRFSKGSLALASGDLIVAVTDGITEAMNASDEEFGEERLAATVRAIACAPAEQITRHIVTAADAFAAGASQHDDMTVVAVRIA
jgi:sigma-B regulation protein RsbU (phosphoserine phosphatase)